MYPTTPNRAETAGLTESFIGSWIASSGRRDDIVLASKIVGEGSKLAERRADRPRRRCAKRSTAA